MDPRLFSQSPDVAPILVRLYDSHRLYSLAKDETPLARAELTSAVVELLEKDLGPRERELISDVLISLMRQAERDLRQAISERLSVIEGAPLRVVLHIANDEIGVAEPMLKNSEVLSDLDLLYIIKGKTPEYWTAIASRRRLSDGVMNVLADTRDSETIKTLSANDGLRLSRHVLEIACEMAEQSEGIARPLLMRSDVPETIARRLYACVGSELKNYIRDYYGLHDLAASDAVDDIVLEFSGAKQNPFMPSQNAIEAADLFAKTGKLSLQNMMDVLQRGQYASFIAMFARFSGLAVGQVHEMLQESSGKVLAITCRALQLSKGDLSRIYMMTQRVRSADRIVDHKDMMRCLAVYDKIELATAREITGINRDHPYN